MTQDELARMLGVDAQTVGRYEKDQSAIPDPVDRLVRLIYVTLELPETDRTNGRLAVVDRLVSGARVTAETRRGWSHVDE